MHQPARCSLPFGKLKKTKLGETSKVVTNVFSDPGWGSQGVSCLVGLTSPIWCFIGPDAGAHMSEELKDASRQLPKAMMWATIANGVMGIAMIITFCFCITDLEATLGADTNFPIINIIHSATGSNAGTCVLGSVLVILLFFSTVTTIASASRQTWAFSRDQVRRALLHKLPSADGIRRASRSRIGFAMSLPIGKSHSMRCSSV